MSTKYEQISKENVLEATNKLRTQFERFIYRHEPELTGTEIDVNFKNLTEAIVRTDKRKEYYRYFHSMNISELKEAALLGFWIIKLKPFTVLKEESTLRTTVNEEFALHHIYCMIAHLVQKKNLGEVKQPSQNFLKDVIYTFQYRDLSKESMILLVASIAETNGIVFEDRL